MSFPTNAVLPFRLKPNEDDEVVSSNVTRSDPVERNIVPPTRGIYFRKSTTFALPFSKRKAEPVIRPIKITLELDKSELGLSYALDQRGHSFIIGVNEEEVASND